MEPPTSKNTQNIQQRQPTIDEQVSLILAHFNRSNNQTAKEAELAVIKIVQQLQQASIQYSELMKKYLDLKEKYEPAKPKEDTVPSKTSDKEPKK